MKTPIYNFLKDYSKKNMVRLHMPGHKGSGRLGIEKYDITEVSGADQLYFSNGIIKESQDNASTLFGAKTFYSTEGSTLAIKAMLAIAVEGVTGRKPLIFAARNAHKAFIYACALLDAEVFWLYGETGSICECKITPSALKNALNSAPQKPDAVYITSPDYLGNIADIKGISLVCREFNIPLLVDNAHGAYLKFLESSLFPIDLGADMAASSAHKTLPVLTGGAYLHIANERTEFINKAQRKLQLFSSSSPSYLILQSLDLCNKTLSAEIFKGVLSHVNSIKELLIKKGFKIIGNEPLKITVDAKSVGYFGFELADFLRKFRIECEYSDEQFLVLMFSFSNSKRDFIKLRRAINRLPIKSALKTDEFPIIKTESIISIREANLSESEEISVEKSVGEICAAPLVSCPPAIPIVVSGEKITKSALLLLKKYGIEKINVIK